MNHKQKRLIIILLFVSTASFTAVFYFNHNSDNKNQTSVNIGTTTLSPRAEAMQQYISMGMANETTTYEGKQYSLVLYRDSEGVRDNKKNPIYNHEDFPQTRGGALIYQEKELVWESTEPIAKLSIYTSRFIDVNNDKKNELMLIDAVGENLAGCDVYIYSFTGNRFRLITPYERLKDIRPEGSKGEFVKTKIQHCTAISDVDGDGKIEIVTKNLSIKGDAASGFDESWITQTYKFNGSEYYLWKETAEPRTEINS